MQRKAVFFDRDGVIVKAAGWENGGKPHSPFSQAEFSFLPYVEEGLKALKAAGFLLVLISNQPDVAYGNLTEKEWQSMQDEVDKLNFDDKFFCRHTRDSDCSCKKPKPGLLKEAVQKWNIALSDSFFVGDTEADISAAEAMKCRTVLIDWPYNRNLRSDFRAGHLLEAAAIIRQTYQV